MNTIANKIIDHRAEQQNKKEKSAGFIIEKHAKNKQIPGSDATVFIPVNQRISKQNNCKKCPKKESGKNQWRILIVKKNAAQRFVDI